MKRSMVTVLMLCMCLYSAMPQQEFEQEGEAPVATLILKKSQIPNEVQQSASKDFTYGEPVQWSNFPYVFQKYGWTVTKGDENVKPDRYLVILKSKNGGHMDAVYTADGKLLRSREILTNGPLPSVITKALNESEYKGWKIDADKELIQDFENQGVKHYVVRVQKDKERKTLYFDEQGKMLAKKKALKKELKEEKKEAKRMEKEETK